MSGDGKPTKLYVGWFCPFAQRSWIAMLEKGVDFEMVDIDPYNKTPEFLAMNPRGLVPTLLHNGKCIYESLVLNEYIDEAWPQAQAPKLMPVDPFQRAEARTWVDFISKKVVPQFYHILQQQEVGKQEEAKGRFLAHLRSFTSAMSPDGPYFTGQDFGLVDIALLPFALRIEILAHYRGFTLPDDGSMARFLVWLDACKSRPAVKGTVAPRDKLMAKYQRYADDTAQTEVADAIRQGTALP